MLTINKLRNIIYRYMIINIPFFKARLGSIASIIKLYYAHDKNVLRATKVFFSLLIDSLKCLVVKSKTLLGDK